MLRILTLVFLFITPLALADDCKTPDITEIKSKADIETRIQQCELEMKYAKRFNLAQAETAAATNLKKLQDIHAWYLVQIGESATELSCEAIDASKVTSVADITNNIETCQAVLDEAIKFNRTAKIEQAKSTLKELESLLLITSQSPLIDPASKDGAADGADGVADGQQEAEKKVFDVAAAFSKLKQATDTASTERLIPAWRDSTFTYQFYAGVEYTKVGDLFDDSQLRLGFQSYVRLFDDLEENRKLFAQNNEASIKDGFRLSYSPHIIGSIQLSGAAEAVAADSETTNDQTSDDGQTTDSNDDTTNTTNGENTAAAADANESPGFEALEFEAAVYWPLYMHFSRSDSVADYRELTAGLIVTAGGRKVDDHDSFYDRYYAGFRMSHNEETYFDVLYGKSEPLKGRRLELRGQLPVASLGTGRVFLGGLANMALSQKKDENGDKLNEGDSFKVYVIWQTSFADLFQNVVP